MNIEGMEFVPVATDITYIKPVDLPTDGKFFVGQYKETFEGQFGANHKFLKKDGGVTVVNGCGSLNMSMENVEPGTWVAITFVGKKELKKGKFAGKLFNDVQVCLCKEPKVELTDDKTVSGDDIPY